MIIRTNHELKARYDELRSGDCFIGMLGFKQMRHAVFVDLMERGVTIVPPPLCQILNTSKTAQAQILGPWMLPHSCVISRRTDLMDAISRYSEAGIGPVVTKEDTLDCGLGVHRWRHIEDVYNHASSNPHLFPFVLQPFLDTYRDVRVIIAGEHAEAYGRRNPNNFRVNLTAGGQSAPQELTDDLRDFCRQVMQRGRFPFAHIDVLVEKDGTQYLSEIALNGGMKGARISREELDEVKKGILETLARSPLE